MKNLKRNICVYLDEERIAWIESEKKRTHQPRNRVIARAIDCLREHSSLNAEAIRQMIREEVEAISKK